MRFNFDQHRFSANATWELRWRRPEVAHERWSAVTVGEWSMTRMWPPNRDVHAAGRRRDHERRKRHKRIVRADYLGAPIGLDETLLRFQHRRLRLPAIGALGTSPRNVIIGPEATWRTRLRATAHRRHAHLADINANNLLNTTRWQSIDTNVNSSTFGQVTLRAMRRLPWPQIGSDMQTRLRQRSSHPCGPPPVGGQGAAFRSGVNLILVDVTVRDGRDNRSGHGQRLRMEKRQAAGHRVVCSEGRAAGADDRDGSSLPSGNQADGGDIARRPARQRPRRRLALTRLAVR